MERNFNWVQRRVTQVSLGSRGILSNIPPALLRGPCTLSGLLHNSRIRFQYTCG